MTYPENHRRANHNVHVSPMGYCVKFTHKDFEISLAIDGEKTVVFKPDSDQLSFDESVIFTTDGTNAAQIVEAVAFIDQLTA